ncbi:membrane protein [sediment metagenome]|uniref:Membrane protein n=1 Tax=sediment metagenome TaxID=749907 RepID=D9PJE2_9ZZZZ
MAQYDPAFVKDFANTLYKQANTVVPTHFFIGMFTGMFLFGIISSALVNTIDILIVSLGVLIGGVLGLSSGRYRAYELKLQAQLALCQVKIEENLRNPS